MFERRDGSLVHEWSEEQTRVPPMEGAQFQHNSLHIQNQPRNDPSERWNSSR